MGHDRIFGRTSSFCSGSWKQRRILQDVQVAPNEKSPDAHRWPIHHVFSLYSAETSKDLLPVVQLILAEISAFKVPKIFWSSLVVTKILCALDL